MANPFQWCNAHKSIVFMFTIFFCCLPFFFQIYDLLNEKIEVNPFETLIATSGKWGVIFILLTLLPTPLRRWLCFWCKNSKFKYGRRISDWNFIIITRVVFGNACVFYALFHAWVYFHFELDWYLDEFFFDLQSRNFIVLGVLSILGLIPLAVTSASIVRRKMGLYWRRLHRSVYVISVLIIAHYILAAKALEVTPYYYMAVLVVLLGHRLAVWLFKPLKMKKDNGEEVYRDHNQ